MYLVLLHHCRLTGNLRVSGRAVQCSCAAAPCHPYISLWTRTGAAGLLWLTPLVRTARMASQLSSYSTLGMHSRRWKC